MKHSLTWLSAVFIAAFAAPLTAQAADEVEMLTIGDKAPALDIEHWIQDNDGKLKPVQDFDAGQVYIVEFWATWCGPCIMSMPHLAETQTEVGYDKVRLISVSDEDLETVEAFLEKPVRGQDEAAEDPQTYDDLTSVYSLTTDPDRSVYKDYMTAAGQNGIPTAFLVGKTGKVEWIGHPMRMDEPLQQVIAGNWDRESFAKEFRAEQESALMMRKITQMMRGDEEEQAEALKLIDKQLEALPDGSRERMQLTMMKMRVLAGAGKGEEAVAMIADAIKAADKSDINAVMTSSQMILMLPPSIEKSKVAELVDSAMPKIETASKSELVQSNPDMKASVYLMVARYRMVADQPKQAIEAFEEAKSLTSNAQMIQVIEQQLEQLKAKMEQSTDGDATS